MECILYPEFPSWWNLFGQLILSLMALMDYNTRLTLVDAEAQHSACCYSRSGEAEALVVIPGAAKHTVLVPMLRIASVAVE